MLVINSINLLLFINVSGWGIFEDSKFKWEWSEEYQTKIKIPSFSQKLKQLEGTEITLSGYYIPMELEGNTIIISKNTFASCFFCGGAGPESVAEVLLKNKHRGLKADQLVSIRGTLKLNKYDYDHLVFMITDAKVITE